MGGSPEGHGPVQLPLLAGTTLVGAAMERACHLAAQAAQPLGSAPVVGRTLDGPSAVREVSSGQVNSAPSKLARS
jgi:hypothetical protein